MYRPTKETKTLYIKRIITTTIVVLATFNTVTTPILKASEFIYSINITIYDFSPAIIPALIRTIKAFPNLQKDTGSVRNVPQLEQMDILLLDNWRELYKPGQARIYPLRQNNKEVINKEFDKLYTQDRIE